LHVFHTGTNKGGKSKVKTYRLKSWQETILSSKRKTFVQFVDDAFEKEK
jgi:hypothetical protein